MTKEEFINQLEEQSKNDHIYSESPTFWAIIEHIKNIDENDEDLKEVLKDDVGLEIIDYFVTNYNIYELNKWLENHEYYIFSKYKEDKERYLESIEDIFPL